MVFTTLPSHRSWTPLNIPASHLDNHRSLKLQQTLISPSHLCNCYETLCRNIPPTNPLQCFSVQHIYSINFIGPLVQPRLAKTEEFSTVSFWEKYLSGHMLLVDICVLDIFSWLNRASIWREICNEDNFWQDGLVWQEVAEASRQLAAIAKRRFMSSEQHFIYEVCGCIIELWRSKLGSRLPDSVSKSDVTAG